MADQKALKKRLKVLMNLPENQICADCNERQPRWASLICAPPGIDMKMGAFMCLECSGSHRRLGVHISFVRSVNLDSWKEQEVQIMEQGGNARVNSVFEATLVDGVKPNNHANGRTREQFIRDKYERRKYYDPSAWSSDAQGPEQAHRQRVSPHPHHMQSASAGVGPPSDAAKLRLEQRRARKASSSVESSSRRERSPKPSVPRSQSTVAAAPVSAPVDLLDFGFDDNTAPPVSFIDDMNSSSTGLSNFLEADKKKAARQKTPPKLPAVPEPNPNPNPPREQLPVQQQQQKSYSADIMSLYSNNQGAPQSFLHPNMMPGMPMMQGMQPNMMLGMQPNNMMMGHSNGMMAHSNMMQPNMMGGAFPNGMQSNMMGGMPMGGNMMGGMPMHGMQQMTHMMQNMSLPSHAMMMQHQHQQQPMMMMQQQRQPQLQQQRQPATPEKEDPFAQFGSNVFRS